MDSITPKDIWYDCLRKSNGPKEAAKLYWERRGVPAESKNNHKLYLTFVKRYGIRRGAQLYRWKTGVEKWSPPYEDISKNKLTQSEKLVLSKIKVLFPKLKVKRSLLPGRADFSLDKHGNVEAKAGGLSIGLTRQQFNYIYGKKHKHPYVLAVTVGKKVYYFRFHESLKEALT